MTDAELEGQESPNWIAVRKDGLTQLVKDLNTEREKYLTVTATFDSLMGDRVERQKP